LKNLRGVSKPKVALLVNLVAPYRVPVYSRLAEYFNLHILHGKMEGNRNWKEAEVRGATLRRAWGWQCTFKRRAFGKVIDKRFLHITPGYFTELVRIRPDAIISNEIGLRTFLALTYGALFRVPVWAWWGGTLHTERNLDTARKVLRRIAAKLVEHWISYGQTSTEYLLSLGVSRSRILQIQNCVDESWYINPVSSGLPNILHPVVLHVGQFIGRKGANQLIEAAATLQSEGLEFSLLLVGNGPDKAELQTQVTNLHLRNVHFIAAQPPEKMAFYYCGADALVFPTLQDVWGLVANEAILSGLPVLCSKYAGCAPELFASECIFDPLDPSEFVSAFRKAVRGQIPRTDPAVLKTSGEVAEMIARTIRAVMEQKMKDNAQSWRQSEIV
jgi:glycosyltransferase involved in cell wall biosynthesis